MRILQIANRYRFYGGEDSSVDRIYETIHSAGVPIERCLFDSGSWDGEDAPSPLQCTLKTLHNNEAFRALRSLQEKFQADLWLVHNVWPVGSPAVYHAASTCRTPVVQYVHNWRPFSISGSFTCNGHPASATLRRRYLAEIREGSWNGSSARTALLGAAMTLARTSGWMNCIHGWIAISEFMRDRFVEAGLRPESVHALRHSWNPKCNGPQMPGKTDGYLFLGRLIEEKGIQTLLEAWEIVSRSLHSATPALKIAGSGPLASELSTVQRPWLKMLGSISGEEKASQLQSCRAVLAPSTWWEPLGLVVYEAYDHSKPVLAASSGGLTETVVHGTTGYLHPPHDAGTLAKQVIELEASPGNAASMGAEGRKWLLANASTDAWRTRFFEIANHCLAQNFKRSSKV